MKLQTLVALFVTLFQSTVALADWFYPGTSVSVAPIVYSSYNHATEIASGFTGGEFGLDHDIGGSSVYLSAFGRGAVDLRGQVPQPEFAWGGGVGYEFKDAGTRFTLGGARDSSERRGGYVKATQQVWRRGAYSLALDSQVQHLVGKNDAVSQVTIGLSNTFGKFCGGQVIAVTAAIMVVSALAFSARGVCHSCGHFDFNWMRESGC